MYMRKTEFSAGKQYIMGILNVTPDSFSDGGRYFRTEDAVTQAVLLQEQGADILDIGACSTRPGSVPVSQEEEIERLLPVLRALRSEITIPVSVDTFRPQIADLALSEGVEIINHVGTFSAAMAQVIKKHNAYWIAVHTAGANAASERAYPDGVVYAVQTFFDDFLANARAYGIDTAQMILDPGFGFGKNERQNLELLQGLDKLKTYGCPLLTALSRKRFVGYACSAENAEDRDAATLTANLIAMRKGSSVFRVHNVAIHRQAFRFLETMRGEADEYSCH